MLPMILVKKMEKPFDYGIHIKNILLNYVNEILFYFMRLHSAISKVFFIREDFKFFILVINIQEQGHLY